MSHYDISYTGLSDSEASAKALADIRDYIGEGFDKLNADFRARYPTAPAFENFEFAVSFAGVQGFPVKVWYEFLWGKQETE